MPRGEIRAFSIVEDPFVDDDRLITAQRGEPFLPGPLAHAYL
jgi:hypothetical protein